MPILCPNCRATLDPASRACRDGHRFAERDGVLILLEAGFERRLQTYLRAFGRARQAEGRRLLDPALYPTLPCGVPGQALPGGQSEWRLRRCDLRLVQRLLAGEPPQRVLEVGAWNGWLSHHLAEAGHDLTAIDYFVDEHDGLGARKFYRSQWRAIQMDLRDLSVLDCGYDVVIVNRCLQFFTDPLEYVETLKARVAPGGRLILTGLQFFWAPDAKARQVAAQQQHYRERYDLGLFLFPAKGYLDAVDAAGLIAAGLRLKPYPELWPSELRAQLVPSRPRHRYGVWHAP